MATDILVDTGEEYVITNDVDGATFIFGVYEDATDSLTDTATLSDITTEPNNTNYSRQTSTVSASNLSGDWGVENDALVEFDFSDVSPGDAEVQDIDAGFIVVNFQSTEQGDSGAEDNLIGNFALQQSRDIGEFDTLELAAGDITLTLD